MTAHLHKAICLTAPTACGKTELALELAEALPLEIISVDSAMVYRGMDVGTAKPSRALRTQVPHHLIDIADPAETYSAGRFLKDATAAMNAVAERGRVPLLVGGTLLYLRALRLGLASLPDADPEVRRELDAEAAQQGWPAMHRRLEACDPDAALRIAPTDRQRIQRALEVYRLTGRPISALQRAGAASAPANVMMLALLPPDRELLGRRIESRFDRMVDEGFVTEVERLRARGDLTEETPSMRAVGYRQLWSYLGGDYDFETARRKSIVATRQLAKRQMTWLRSEREVETFAAFSPELARKLLERIESEFAR